MRHAAPAQASPYLRLSLCTPPVRPACRPSMTICFSLLRTAAFSFVVSISINATYPQWTKGHTVLHPGFVILLRYCRSAYVHTLRTSALQNHKSETQNSFGPWVPSSGGWQGNGMRRTGRTPLAVNAAIHQKTVPGACVPLSAEGKLRHVILLTEPAIPSGNICELAGILL